jgi:hypothetical protein
MNRVNHDSSIDEFLSEFTPDMADLRRKLLRQKKVFEGFGFVTPGALLGTLNVRKPADHSTHSRIMTAAARRSFDETTNDDRRKRQLATLLHLSPREMGTLYERLVSLPRPSQWSHRVKSEGYTGSLVGHQPLRSTRSYHVLSPQEWFRDHTWNRKRVLLPDLEQRLGTVWDQGQRGTCVAFAVTGLVHYLRGRNHERPSPQFLYHQCKLIDGIPNMSGTYPQTAMQVVANRAISGAAHEWGTADAGIPSERTWPYVSNEIGRNEAQTPPSPSNRESIYQTTRWANTNGEILRTSSSGQSMVDEIRFLVGRVQVPAVVGLDLFPSFHNPYVRRTGMVSLPIGDEEAHGRHAMLIVGYDDIEGVFLVRNSWSAEWGPENPWRFAGHAIIPYAYVARYSGSPAYAMRNVHGIRDVNVPESIRLYNRKLATRRGENTTRKPSVTRTRDSTKSSRRVSPPTTAINRTPRQPWRDNAAKQSLLRRLLRAIF